MRLETACLKAFNKHETFAPRFGWAKKAYDSCSSKDHDLYQTSEGLNQLTLELGVGKSMVKSIRHWGSAFRIFAEVKQAGSRSKFTIPTTIGETFFSDKKGYRGWDPYCEHPDTLWLLHWWLLAPGSRAPVWWLAFNEFPGLEFTPEELEQYVLDRTTNWNPSESSIKRDVRCMLQMYASGHSVRSTFDDQLDSPFRELDLLRPSERDPGMFRFLIGPKISLAPSIALFASLDFLSRTKTPGRTVTVSRLATEPGSPGKVFNLTESALFSLLETAVNQYAGGLKLTSAAGVPQLALSAHPAVIATDLLWTHYKSLTDDPRSPAGKSLAGPESDLPIGTLISS
jgi:hypothetical protein